MKTPYLLHFDVPFESVSDHLPKTFTHRLASAVSTYHYSFGATDLGVQHMNLRPFYVELFELNSRPSFSFSLEITDPQHFLFFMLQGQVRFSTPEGFYLSHAPEGHLTACFKAPGHYRLKLPPGRHVACCVTLESGWLHYATEKLPALRQQLQTPPALPHAFLPFVPITLPIRHRLVEVLALKRNGQAGLDGFLRQKFALILEHYALRATEKERSLVYSMKKFLDDHFTEPLLTYEHLSERFQVKERSLRYHFQKEFGISINQFLIHKRLQLAHKLITHEGLPVRDVYLTAGYQDESTFRYAYRKFFSR